MSQRTVLQCEQCGKIETDLAKPPAGWIVFEPKDDILWNTLVYYQEYNDYLDRVEPKAAITYNVGRIDFCSEHCLLEWLRGIVKRAQEG